MLSVKIEQHVNLKFSVNLNKTPTECLQILTQAYGEDCMSRTRVFEWHKRFTEGREERQSKLKFKTMLITFFNIKALSVKQFLVEKRIATLEHSPYSPDLAPCDFFFFPKIKSVLKGTRFESLDTVKKTSQLLKQLSENELQHAFDQ
ncbi:uncharacterized protein [Anoplolepis gracilipes]|uniref:uncharacterized protein n=1 Tax=Anoplolepis gracilipes TaxID=354296 RepID=UPI003BA3747B